MRALRWLRLALALATFVSANLFFFGLASGAALLFKVQLLPAVLACNLVTVAAVVAVTLLFGRVYCSVICPMGVFQDVVIWIRRKAGGRPSGEPNPRSFRWVRAVSLAATVALIGLGLVSFGALLDGYSLYGRIATQVFKPVYSALQNLVGGWMAESGHPWLFREAVFVRGTCAFVVALCGLVGVGALAWWRGRLFCNTLCPVGAALALASTRPLVRLAIDPAKCVKCGLCAKGCKCGAIDVKNVKVDDAACVRCFDCVTTCRKGALSFKISRLIVTFVAVVALSSAVAEEETRPEENRAWTIHRFRREFCGEDSWEPFNRSMFAVFDWGMEYVVDPFCVLYSSIVPKPLIECIENFSENVEYPRRLVADLCMGEGTLAWDATERFFINTTLGVGGLFDPACKWFGIYDDNSSLSDAFACWGVPAGPQLALPFVPRASVRGHVGYALDYVFDAKTWFDFFVPSGIFLGYSWSLTPNKGPVWNGAWQSVFRHENDTYALYMPIVAAASDCNLRQTMAHVARGDARMDDVRQPVRAAPPRPEGLKGRWFEIPGYASRGPALDSLRALCFAPLDDDSFWWNPSSVFNNDFAKRIDERSVEIAEGVEAQYSFVAAPEKADGTERLVVVVPGIGAGRTSSEVVAMGEFLQGTGYAVVLCDSLFHWESMRTVNHGILPGNLTEDAKRFGVYLKSLLADLRKDGLVCEPEVSIIGWSMGGLTAMHLAALDEKGLLPVEVKRFVAINPPPTSFERGLKPFTKVMEASRSWTREKAWDSFGSVVGALYGWVTQRHPRYDPKNPPKDEEGKAWCYSPNLTEEQANYLLGMTLRRCLLSLVAERHRNEPFPWVKSKLTWFSREAFYDEVGEMRLDDYLNKYLASCYPDLTIDELRAATETRAQFDVLKRCQKLSLIHTWNDPLLIDEDRRTLDALFEDRITWFADGAHCGYFYTKPFQDELLRHLRQ